MGIIYIDCIQLSNNITCTRCDDRLFLKVFEDGSTTCTTHWGVGYYGQFQLTKTSYDGITDFKQCQPCDSSCNECVDVGPNRWTSCKSGYYLNILKGGHIGTCVLKSTQNLTLGLFVASQSPTSNEDGSFLNPYSSIIKALNYANQAAAPYNYATIIISLLNGEHIMSREMRYHTFMRSAQDTTSVKQYITIQPVFWGQTINGHSFQTGDSDCIESGNKLTVVYQLGNDFAFKVSGELAVRYLIFDALDSSIPVGQTCQYSSMRCCQIDGTSITQHPNNLHTTNCTVAMDQTEYCLTTAGDALFKFIKEKVTDSNAKVSYQV